MFAFSFVFNPMLKLIVGSVFNVMKVGLKDSLIKNAVGTKMLQKKLGDVLYLTKE